MRVCIVTESFLPQVNGVTNSVLRLADHLEINGHKALIVAPSGSLSNYKSFPVIHAPALHLRRFGDVRISFAINRLIDQIFEFRPDVIHLASPALLGYQVGVEAQRRKIPTVGIFQTDLAGFAKHYGFGLTSNSIWRWVSTIHKNMNRTLAPSNKSCEDLRSLDVPDVYLWQRGVDTTLFNPSKRNGDLQKSFPGKKIIGFVGRLAHEKRVQDLIPVSQNPAYQLVIVGDGPARAELENLMPEAHFTGALHGEELATTFANFDCFVHTGPNETFCQAVQEALASGVPTIAVNQGGPTELVDHGKSGFLIETSNQVELIGAINKILDPLNHANFATHARVSVQHRSWNSVMRQLFEHYDEVIKSQKNLVAA